MKPRRLFVSLMALMLLIPAATAYGADQEVHVNVWPADALAVSVDTWADMGVEAGRTAHFDFWLNVLNTKTTGWEVTVTGDALQSGHWTDCQPGGWCSGWVNDEVLAFSTDVLQITGGDLDWWDAEDPTGNTIRPDTGPVGTPILQATSYAHGNFGLDKPRSYLEVTPPLDDPATLDVDESGAGLEFHTMLTYTIAVWTPAT